MDAQWYSLYSGLMDLAIIFICLGFILRNHKHQIERFIKIRSEWVPMCKSLEEKYDAKYPILMYFAYCDELESIKYDESKTNYFFMANDNFIIVNKDETIEPIKIPAKSVQYHKNYIDHDKKVYGIQLYFPYRGEKCGLQFETPMYNRFIDKRYAKYLDGKPLYDFVCQNFPRGEI